MLGEDFTEPSPLQVTFSSGDMVGDTACTTLGIINDDNLESDHEFTVSIQSTSPQAMLGVSSSVTATIMDDDRKSTLRCK